MQQWAPKARRLTAFVLAMWMTAFFLPFLPASAETGRTIRVALLSQEGISQRSESGNWSGIVIDFLDEISNCTGWKYEYTQVTQKELERSDAGERFDLVRRGLPAPELEGSLPFPPAP